ncbi:hypothetical protein COLO4_13965 [Corchorus olitorius]|uniref:Uncharacterized protein n=1 Tax=Corchorus olitorius TaxID=93759 RepID=A0A1R3JTZ7_9ROSI|nr:hypothetical protein COLO4_13965 [Corchorus olitorius]
MTRPDPTPYLVPPVTMQPSSFSISNFTLNWEAEFNFGCQNCTFDEAHYTRIEAYITYTGNSRKSSKVSMEPFTLGANEERKVHVKFGSSNQTLIATEENDYVANKKMEWEMLHMTLTLQTEIKYKSDHDSVLMDTLDCWDLLLGLIPETGGGN